LKSGGDTRIVKGIKTNESLLDGYTGAGHGESGSGVDEEDGETVPGIGVLHLPAQAAL
jgi:hypothetical protein